MKLNVQWLKDYIDANDDIEKLADELTMSGSEVEEIEKPFEKLQGVVWARVVNVKKHPNADKLNVCVLNTGEKEYITVTSDLNVMEGDVVPFGPAGKASTADGKKIEATELRGVKTEGMMFSLEELGLEAHSDGVFRFKERVKIGEDVKKTLGLDLTTFELEITPNRPDCLSHVGLAREVSTVEKKPFKIPSPSVNLANKEEIDVEIESSGCWRYMAVRIDSVKVQSSPLWLKRRLASVGLRSINNIADITNYVMMELGHPVHAFDYDKIPNGKLVIRDAKKGEKLLALNSKEYEFEGGEILITDGENPLAIAGVIGGKESGVSLETTRVLLEIATFDPVKVRKASKKLNISTDASFRFERGVDANDAELVAKRLVELITSLARGYVVGFKDLYPHEMNERSVYLQKRKLDSYVAYTTKEEEVEDCFTRLGFKTEKEGDGWNVTVPTFRRDIMQDVDLIEEFARIHGLENLPQTRSLPFIFSKKNEWWNFKVKAKMAAAALGYYEAVTYPFVDPKIVERFYDVATLKSPKLINALSPEMSLMRPDLVIGLLEASAYNLKHQQKAVRLFEVGKIFEEEKEREMIAFISAGRLNEEDYTDKRNSEILNVKGDVEAFVDALHAKVDFSQKNIKGFEDGRSAEIILNGKVIGKIGEISREVLESLDVKVPIHYADVDLKSIYDERKSVRYKRYSQYPSSFKDLSMFVEKGRIKAEEILKIAKNSSPYVSDVKVSDLYRGKHIPKSVYSITITITYNSMEKTLSEDEINEAFTTLMETLDSLEGVTVRKVQ